MEKLGVPQTWDKIQIIKGIRHAYGIGLKEAVAALIKLERSSLGKGK
jgi:ribosomal protein L7/L12